MVNKKIILGYPGTGKTYTLMNYLDKYFKDGITPNNICFCSYTKSAANEIKDRSINKFNLNKEDMIYFGTIHSLCFRRFCFGKELIKPKQLKQFFDLKNLEFQENKFDEDILVNETFGDEVGNKLINFYNLLRITECKGINQIEEKDLQYIFNKLKINEENFIPIFVNIFNPYSILQDYEKFKKKNNLIDFTDMLLIAYNEKWIVPTNILIIDEAQDISPIQWAIYDNWKQNKKEIILAGDDDQSIYGFNGANPKRLLSECKDAKVIILEKTYRLSENINNYCLEYINNNISPENRIIKNVTSIKSGGEIIEENIDYDLERVINFIRSDKFTYILFRTNNYKKQFINEILIPNGLIYHEIRGISIWNTKNISLFNAIIKLSNKNNITPTEVKYLIENISGKFKLLRRGLKTQFKDMDKKDNYSINDLIEIGFDLKIFDYLTNFKILSVLNIKDNIKSSFLNLPKQEIKLPIKLFVGTIHSSKGKEADDVIIFKDISKKIAKEITKDKESWENEIRVFHTGQTRTKERLIILRGGFEFCEPDLIP